MYKNNKLEQSEFTKELFKILNETEYLEDLYKEKINRMLSQTFIVYRKDLDKEYILQKNQKSNSPKEYNSKAIRKIEKPREEKQISVSESYLNYIIKKRITGKMMDPEGSTSKTAKGLKNPSSLPYFRECLKLIKSSLEDFLMQIEAENKEKDRNFNNPEGSQVIPANLIKDAQTQDHKSPKK